MILYFYSKRYLLFQYPKFTTLHKPIPKIPQNHHHHQHSPIAHPTTISQPHNQIEELIPMTSNDLDVNIKGISDLLMSTRVPESCV